MIVVLCAVAAGYGAHLLFTAVVLRWRGLAPGPVLARRSAQPRLRRWMAQAGLGDVRPVELAGVITVLALLGTIVALALFGGPVAAIVIGACAAVSPLASYRQRRQRRLAVARESWPRMIEEMRVLTGSLGRSVPTALFEVGRRGPVELRVAFDAAHREWLLTTDFERTVALLAELLADPTADAALETLLVAHELGGTTLDRRLEALAIDRAADVQSRQEAAARQAGVRFARRFVLLVPAGMALVGLQIGSGRKAYSTAGGQLGVVIAIAMVALCWVWAGRLLTIPGEERVFGSGERAG